MAEKSDKGIERRSFLKTAGVAAVGAAAAQAPAEAEARETAPERTKRRYQETEHVRRFYALNRWVSGV